MPIPHTCKEMKPAHLHFSECRHNSCSAAFHSACLQGRCNYNLSFYCIYTGAYVHKPCGCEIALPQTGNIFSVYIGCCYQHWNYGCHCCAFINSCPTKSFKSECCSPCAFKKHDNSLLKFLSAWTVVWSSAVAWCSQRPTASVGNNGVKINGVTNAQ